MPMENENPPVEGVTIDPDTGNQKVNWKGVIPESDHPYDPEVDGYSNGGFPVGH